MRDISVILTCHNDVPLYWEKIKSTFDKIDSMNKINFEVITSTNSRNEFFNKVESENQGLYKVVYSEGGKDEFLEVKNGIEAAEGKYICFHDSDDYFFPGKLEKIKKIFDEDKEVVYIVNRAEGIKNKYFAMDFNLTSISTRKEILNPDYYGLINMMPDTLTYYSARNTGKKMLKLEEPLNFYHISDKSASRRNRKEKFDKSIYSLNLMKKWFPSMEKELMGRLFEISLWANDRVGLDSNFFHMWSCGYYPIRKKIEYSAVYMKRLIGV